MEDAWRCDIVGSSRKTLACLNGEEAMLQLSDHATIWHLILLMLLTSCEKQCVMQYHALYR